MGDSERPKGPEQRDQGIEHLVFSIGDKVLYTDDQGSTSEWTISRIVERPSSQGDIVQVAFISKLDGSHEVAEVSELFIDNYEPRRVNMPRKGGLIESGWVPISLEGDKILYAKADGSVSKKATTEAMIRYNDREHPELLQPRADLRVDSAEGGSLEGFIMLSKNIKGNTAIIAIPDTNKEVGFRKFTVPLDGLANVNTRRPKNGK